MIYPNKINAKKGDIIIKVFALLSVLIAILLIVINRFTKPQIPWAMIANAGIIYVWIVVWYSIRKNINIAGHVMVQTIALSLLTVYIDYQLGFKGWSINIAIPIMIIVANITMLILTIISHKKYIKYAMYQLVIVLFSTLPIVFIEENMVQNKVLSIVATGISALNLLLSFLLSSRDLKEAVVRKFHV